MVGTASWTDKTLLESGWYPPEATTPEERLRFYAEQFPLVEVDSTYYTPPNERKRNSGWTNCTRAWAEVISLMPLSTPPNTAVMKLQARRRRRPIIRYALRPRAAAISCRRRPTPIRQAGPAKINGTCIPPNS